MHIYKLIQDTELFLRIDKDSFEAETHRRSPYYQIGEDRKQRHYAVCPGCDNPIQIIGLYRTDNPYGKHHNHSVPRLAMLDREKLKNCPLYYPRKQYAPGDRKGQMDQIAIRVLEGLINNFDRVVYLLQQLTGIRFSENMLRKMLENYRASQGYLYMGAMPINIPWIFAYMSGSQNLISQYTNPKDSELLKALGCDTTIQIVENQIRQSEGIRFTTLNFCFIRHRKHSGDTDKIFSETMEMVISKNNQQTVFRRRISFDHLHFQRLCNYSAFHSRPEQIRLAQDVLGSLLPVA